MVAFDGILFIFALMFNSIIWHHNEKQRIDKYKAEITDCEIKVKRKFKNEKPEDICK